MLDLNIISSNENESKSILFCSCFLAKLLFHKHKLKSMLKTLKVGINWFFIQIEIHTFQTLQTNQLYCIFFPILFYIPWMDGRTYVLMSHWIQNDNWWKISYSCMYLRDSIAKRVNTLWWFIIVCQIVYKKSQCQS